jgi:hypothetical protein
MTSASIERGRYVDFENVEGNLVVRLNENGQASFSEIEAYRNNFGVRAALITLLDDHLANGWEMIEPDEIGVQTSALILSDEIWRDEEGRIAVIGHCYGFPDYQIIDEIEELRQKLVLVFQACGN